MNFFEFYEVNKNILRLSKESAGQEFKLFTSTLHFHYFNFTITKPLCAVPLFLTRSQDIWNWLNNHLASDHLMSFIFILSEFGFWNSRPFEGEGFAFISTKMENRGEGGFQDVTALLSVRKDKRKTITCTKHVCTPHQNCLKKPYFIPYFDWSMNKAPHNCAYFPLRLRVFLFISLTLTQ